MKKRIRALKAIILVVLMVVELFGMDALRALAETIYVNDPLEITENSVEGTADEYNVGATTLTIANNITVLEPIYGSGATIVNNGKVSTIGRINAGTINNAAGAVITTISDYDGDTDNKGEIGSYAATGGTITNTGTIQELGFSSYGTLNFNGGQITTLTSAVSSDSAYKPQIVVGADASVGSIAGAFGISGSGTLKVTNSLELTGDYSDPSCTIEVTAQTKITVASGSKVKVTYGSHTYLLEDGTNATISELAGHKITAVMQDTADETMEVSTAFPTDKKFLNGEQATAVYKAKDGYYFPTNYAVSKTQGNGTATVNRTDARTIEIIFTFADESADVSLSIPAASAKGEQAAPNGLSGGVEEVSGVTEDMEYAASADAEESAWIPVTGIADGDTITLAKGTWYFRYRETDDKKAGASASVVVKGKGEATVEIADVYYGGTPNPKAATTTNTGVQAVIEYKEASADDSTYSTTAPTAIGTYTVRATFAATDEYGEASATADFTIRYLEAPVPAYTLEGTVGENGYYISEVTVTPADGYQISRTLDGTYEDSLLVKEDADESVIYLKNKTTGEKTGAVSLEAIKIDTADPILNVVDGEVYKVKSKELEVIDSNLASVTVNGIAQTVSGQSFTTELAEAAESYVIVAKDKAGRSITATISVKRDAQAAPTGLTGGIEEVSGVTTDMEYAVSETATDWTAVTGIKADGTITLAKGTWYFRYKETDTKLAGAAIAVTVKEPEKEPEIIKAEGSGTIFVDNVHYGRKPHVQITSETNDASQAEIVYKEKGKPDAAYEKTIPTKVGSYTVHVTLPENDAYKAVAMTADFSITYLGAPAQPYTLAGTKGENGYYTSDVIVKPAAGYTIAMTLDGTYADSLRIQKTQPATTIYLKNAAGEITDAILLEPIRIKQDAPKLNLENGRTYYGDTQKLVIQDAYLHQVYVNGVLQSSSGPEKILELHSYNGRKRYEITAVDDAGNKRTIVVNIAAAWLKTGIVPDGVLVNLESGNGYKLGSGNWQVEGDTTSYSGNAAFYVKKDGSYTFKSH